jgi:prepilin-type N-terminal cleavage/methylation domain-containing protein/prepilin-type processing-associated H-X9-DG protein
MVMASTQRIERAFTLIELLVVIAIIALMVGILLPARGSARSEARTTKCAANARTIAQAVATYGADFKGLIPPSYVYGMDQTTSAWRVEDQLQTHPNPGNGYVHWSYALLSSDDQMPEEAFQCPATRNGGAPATNPGENVVDWETGWQQNDQGASAGAYPPKDRQAHRMAYTGNAAIFPRNKFSQGSARRNRLVVDSVVTMPVRTALATEFLEMNDWQSIAEGQAAKSHRPVTPFVGGSAGADVYNEPDVGDAPRFFYPQESDIKRAEQLGNGMIVDQSTTLNAVGRHHAGGDKAYGGTVNFVFMDGHIERLTLLQSIRERKWGDRFYSLTGRNTKVDTNGF